MATVSEALSIALDHHIAGRVAEAETLYGRILEAVPGHPDASHLMGLLLAQTGRVAAAAAGRCPPCTRRIAGGTTGSGSRWRVGISIGWPGVWTTLDQPVLYLATDLAAVSNSSFSVTAAMLNPSLRAAPRPDREAAWLVPFDPWNGPVLLP